MPERDEILAYCDELLDVGSFQDYGPNGLQIPGRREVTQIATGVSADPGSLGRARGGPPRDTPAPPAEGGAELVMTHHGLLWGDGVSPLSVPMAARLRALLCADCSLAAYHLPLDAHPEIGNNALLRDALALEPDERPFVRAKGSPVGLIRRAAGPIALGEVQQRPQ